jgi:quinolinate synthase
MDAGCSLSESCPPDKLAAFLKQHADKNYYVIAYINCSAGVKALSDVICTSGNADRIVNAAPTDRNILFVPDQNLGAWVMERTGRQMDLWQGNCYVHVEFTARSIGRIRDEYPDAPVVAHPECTYAVRMLADEVCSTEKMVTFCRNSPAKEIIVVTEAGMLHRLQKEVPGKRFIPGPTDNCFCGECRFMKMNTLEKAHAALLNLAPQITIPEPLRKRAEAPILRMLELSR